MKRVAIPCEGGRIAAHFGHAPQFVLFDVDAETGRIAGEEVVEAPPHQPGLLPAWLAERGAAAVLTGGMGQRAIQLFAARGIEVVAGVSEDDPRRAAEAYAKGELQGGANVCDHPAGEGEVGGGRGEGRKHSAGGCTRDKGRQDASD